MSHPGNTGTEAWVTQVSRSGIPTVLVSIPLKYMHTTVETVHLEDIKNSGKLVSKFILSIDSEKGGYHVVKRIDRVKWISGMREK